MAHPGPAHSKSEYICGKQISTGFSQKLYHVPAIVTLVHARYQGHCLMGPKWRNNASTRVDREEKLGEEVKLIVANQKDALH